MLGGLFFFLLRFLRGTKIITAELKKNVIPKTVIILLFKNCILFRFGNSSELLERFNILEQRWEEYCITLLIQVMGNEKAV